ncbi:MAG: IS4 family transposase [Nitrospirae bacterium]|nr:MAG: IS4 family transposase [Nitrospirota bacterium]
MDSVEAHRRPRKNRFDTVSEPFLQQSGLPFAEVLSGETIERTFAQQDGLFAEDDIFSTPIVLWAFLAQVLRGGKGAACASAVADIATYMQQTGGRVPSGDTGDYCRARSKLNLSALRELVVEAAQQLQEGADSSWRWHGLDAQLIDGFTFTLPDTPENQEEFPQQKNQSPGVGLPIARACAVLSLATAAIHDLNIGPYQGKETGESALLRGILDGLQPGDVAVFDRYFCSFMMLAMLRLGGVHFCARLHQRRPGDFRQGKRLGYDDRLVTWTRPKRPPWMSEEWYEQIPETMTLREVRFQVTVPGRRTETLIVVTSLIDPAAYPKEDIAELYGFRWNAELDIRDIKQTLGLDHVRCKTPDMVRRELWVTLLAYNLIRKLIATAAAVHAKQPRQLGFTLACQTILSSWMLLATGACRDACQLWRLALERIAANEVANRPGRIEPRVIKRRRHRYPLMRVSRQKLRQAVLDSP